MAGFTRMAFDPADGLKNRAQFPSTPDSEDEARGQIQGLLDQITVRLNALMGALENIDAGASGAEKIGSAPITDFENCPTNLWAQLVAVNDRLTAAITGGINISAAIGAMDIKTAMLDDGAVTSPKIADGAVSSGKIPDGAVTAAKLGTISTLTLAAGDTLTYDDANGKIRLNVDQCESVQLCPVVFGLGANAPVTGKDYPAGTIYIQYV